MSTAKTVRLEVRLPENMMHEIKKIAPANGDGKPNISALVRDALQREIHRNSTRGMVDWAKRNLDTLKDINDEWDVTSGDGFSTN